MVDADSMAGRIRFMVSVKWPLSSRGETSSLLELLELSGLGPT